MQQLDSNDKPSMQPNILMEMNDAKRKENLELQCKNYKIERENEEYGLLVANQATNIRLLEKQNDDLRKEIRRMHGTHEINNNETEIIGSCNAYMIANRTMDSVENEQKRRSDNLKNEEVLFAIRTLELQVKISKLR